MQTILLNHPVEPQKHVKQPIVLALGFFDGVHRGHQEVILSAARVAKQRGLPLAVMTFNEHPAIIFKQVSAQEVRYLTSVQRKASLMANLGVDIFYVVSFTPEFASMSPQTFVDEYMVGLNAQVVVAGFDYTYGKRDVANMETLPNFAKKRFEIVTVPELDLAGEKISSSHIRQALDQGNISKANELLGYIYETKGIVVHGEARGRTLGFPTANIQTIDQMRLPGVGIYAVKMQVNGVWYQAMASIGYNVTFGDNRELTVEINLFDFDQDIYDAQVTVAWYTYLRAEQKFAGAEGLIDQLKADRQATKAFFDNLDKGAK